MLRPVRRVRGRQRVVLAVPAWAAVLRRRLRRQAGGRAGGRRARRGAAAGRLADGGSTQRAVPRAPPTSPPAPAAGRALGAVRRPQLAARRGRRRQGCRGQRRLLPAGHPVHARQRTLPPLRAQQRRRRHRRRPRPCRRRRVARLERRPQQRTGRAGRAGPLQLCPKGRRPRAAPHGPGLQLAEAAAPPPGRALKPRASPPPPQTQAASWEQCGGIGSAAGADAAEVGVCCEGGSCSRLNARYWQCLPGAGAGSSYTPGPSAAPAAQQGGGRGCQQVRGCRPGCRWRRQRPAGCAAGPLAQSDAPLSARRLGCGRSAEA